MGGTRFGQSIPAGPPNARQGIVRAPGEVAIARHPVYNYRPADGIPFDKFGAIPLPASPSGFVPIFSFQVPRGYNAIITHIACEQSDPAYVNGDGSILWAIAQNFAPSAVGLLFFQDYSSIPVELGFTYAPSRIEDLPATEQQTIALLVNNVSSVLATPTAGRILGWFYPVEARPANTSF